VGAQRG